jgi:RNA polymerase sigma factor (sigma-70 family)
VAKAPVGVVLNRLFQAMGGPPADATDEHLLEAFVARRDESAFSALLRRYGGMVLHVCRRVLHNSQDAEDAFQATFLLLARKAGTIRKQQSLAGWLYQVAYRLAIRVKAQHARREAREQQAVRMQPTPAGFEVAWRELQEVLDEELHRLPAKYRDPLVLCYLQGLTHEEAAGQLGWPLGTVRGRVARARDLLRGRLARRGLSLTAAAFSAVLAADVARAVPAGLLGRTCKAAVSYAGGRAAGVELVTTQAAALAEGGLTAMATTSGKFGLALVLAVGLALAGVAGLAGRPAAGPQQAPKAGAPAGEPQKTGQPDKGKAGPEGRDLHGDPLPVGASVRLGSARLWPGMFAFGLTSLDFTRAGNSLAMAGSDGAVHVWDTATGKEVARLTAPEKGISQFPRRFVLISFSPDGKTLAALDDRLCLRLWDVKSGKTRVLQALVGGRIGDLAFAPDGKVLALPDSFGAVRRWNVVTGKELPPLKGHSGPVRAVAFSADGKLLASGGEDRDVILWEAATGKPVHRCLGHRDGVFAVAFAPDGKTLASRGGDGAVRIWERVTGRQVRWWRDPVTQVFSGQERLVGLMYSRDGKTLAAGGFGGLRMYDPATGKELRYVVGAGGDRGPVVPSPDGRYLATLFGQRLHLLDAATGKILRRSHGHEGGILVAAFSPDRKTLATGSRDRTIRLWDLATGRELRTLRGHSGAVHHLRFALDGKHLVSASEDANDRVVSRWDVDTGAEVQQFRTRGKGVQALHLSADGKRLTVLEKGTSALSWDTATGTTAAAWRLPNLFAAALSADGKTLAILASAPMLEWQLLDMKPSATPRRMEGRGIDAFGKAVFSTDGRLLLTVSPNMSLRLWDVFAARSVRWLYKPVGGNFPGQRSQNAAPAFSPDGRVVAVPGRGGEVALLEVATGKERRTLNGGQGPVSFVAFTPEGDRLVTGSEDGTALVWNWRGEGAAAAKLAEEELQGLWEDLAGEDAGKGYRAIRALAACPGQAVGLLKGRLPAETGDKQKQITKLIADLKSKQLAVRKKAEAELERLGPAARPALLEALKGKPSLDVTQRLEGLLRGLEEWRLTPEQVRMVRCVEALEAAGTEESRDLLAEWARGAPEALLTEEARASLARLSKGSR